MNITNAEVLHTHPSVQDINIISSPNTNNPMKQARMQHFRNQNANFVGDKPIVDKSLCAPTGGPRVVVVRNEDNIRKGVTPKSVVGASLSGHQQHNHHQQQASGSFPFPASLSEKEKKQLAAELSLTTPTKTKQAAGGSEGGSGSLPPRSPGGASAAAAAAAAATKGKKIKAVNEAQLRALSMPDLVRHAAQRRKPGATPSDISLVTSVESRDASTNHPCSETVYTCSCCRPRRPRSRGSSVVSASVSGSGSEADSMYENMTSVSQRGGAGAALAAMGSGRVGPQHTVPKPEQQISAKQVFELIQARAGGAGSLGHNLVGSSGRGQKPMGFGLISQEALRQDSGRNAKAPPSEAELEQIARSQISELTATTRVSQQQQRAASNASSHVSGSRASRASRTSRTPSATSTQVRELEAQLEDERRERMRSQMEMAKIRDRQQRLLATLSAEERAKMQALLADVEEE